MGLLVNHHRDGPNGPARGEELAQKACQARGKMFPHGQRGPVKKGVSFDEVRKPRKQLCSPPFNLDRVPNSKASYLRVPSGKHD
jgi:hypothetical protein